MTLHDLLLRVRALLSPRRVEHELDEELASTSSVKHISTSPMA